MQRELEMLDALFEYATEGIIICDQRGTIRMSNPSVGRMFGYTPEELKGKPVETLLPARYKDKHISQRDGYIHQPAPRAMGHGRDLYGRRKDGSEIMVEVSLSPFSTSTGEFIMSFIVDITERKRNESELRLAHERLKQTSEALATLNADLEEKVRLRTDELAQSKQEVIRALEREIELNELKSRFITTASHEFRTPLGTILSSASLVLRYDAPGDTDKRRKHIERIKAGVNNLTEILNDFLSIEKLEEGLIRSQPRMFDLAELANEVAEDMRSIARPGQIIEITYDGPSEVNLDSQLLKNALINLVSNAIKYSPDNAAIHIGIDTRGDAAKIAISDNGIGIPEEDQAYIFDRFYRAKNCGNVQGTGLGLNIVKKYIELMNGTIALKSVFGQGTTFFVEIPLT